MQPRVAQVGPLAAASATKVALSQTAPAAGYLALNGAASTAVANNICLSQSGTAATALLINGSLAQTLYTAPVLGVAATTIAMLTGTGSPITITSAGNDSGITFAIVGTVFSAISGPDPIVKETITGSNASIVASANSYQSIISITPSGNTASTVTVGAMGLATLDVARRVILTSGGNDTGLTFTVSGTDAAGDKISETVTGASGAAASTVLDYLTVTSVKTSGATATTITVGTNGVASSPWVNLDSWAMGTVAGQTVVSGVVNYTVEVSNDDPNSYGNPIGASAMSWNGSLAGVNGSTTSTAFALAVAPLWARVTLNSETGAAYVRMTLAQSLSVPV